MSLSVGASIIAPGFNLNIGVGRIGALGVGTGFVTAPPAPPVLDASYMLMLRSPGGAKTLAADPYIFPIGFMSMRKVWTALSTRFDTAGTPKQRGVQRNMDQFGNTPPSFIIEGTTGWDFHASDGGALTGLQSMAALENLFGTYAQLNQQQVANQQADLYTMEFYDYFRQQFWEVVPVGEQEIRQDERRPILCMYALRFDAIRDLSAVPDSAAADPVQSAFQTSPSQGAAALDQTIGGVQDDYGDLTAGHPNG